MTELINMVETSVVKAENTFCVALRDGRLPLDADHPLGLYRDDCRHLSGRELVLEGVRRRLLVFSDAAGSAAVFELTNPELTLRSGSGLPAQSVSVRVERRVSPQGMLELITLRAYTHAPIELDAELRLAADFVPMLESAEWPTGSRATCASGPTGTRWSSPPRRSTGVGAPRSSAARERLPAKRAPCHWR